jgi:hypothetical protein
MEDIPLEHVLDSFNARAAARIAELEAEVARLTRAARAGGAPPAPPRGGGGIVEPPLHFRTLRSVLALPGGIFIQPNNVLGALGKEKPTRQLEMLLHEALVGGEYLLVDDVLASL